MSTHGDYFPVPRPIAATSDRHYNKDFGHANLPPRFQNQIQQNNQNSENSRYHRTKAKDRKLH